MKLLLDAGLPRRTCALLRANGHDVVHANEIQLGMPDDEILQLAQKQGRIIFTLDADFHSMLALQGAATPSVVRLRVQTLRHDQAAFLIQSILDRCGAELQRGAVISADAQRVRIRMLPLT